MFNQDQPQGRIASDSSVSLAAQSNNTTQASRRVDCRRITINTDCLRYAVDRGHRWANALKQETTSKRLPTK